MTRVLAVVGAALLIAVAVLVRGILEDDDGATADDGGDEPADLVVACIPELEDVCDQLDVADLRIEDPEETIAAPDDVDAWVTLDPWPEIAGETTSGPLTDAGTPLAQTDLVLVLFRNASEQCPDATWTCVVNVFGDRVGARPSESALGLLSLGNAAADWFVTTVQRESYAANDFAEPGFRAWIAMIDASDDPLEEMLQFRGSDLVVAGTSSTDATAQLATAADSDSYSTAPGAVPATVVAVVTGRAADSIVQPLQNALVAAGWDAAPPDARSSGLPSPGVLFALAQEVS